MAGSARSVDQSSPTTSITLKLHHSWGSASWKVIARKHPWMAEITFRLRWISSIFFQLPWAGFKGHLVIYFFFKKTWFSVKVVAFLGLWELVPAQCSTVANVLNWCSEKKTSLNLFANFSDKNTPTITNLKLPMWCHWMWSWEEMCTVSSWGRKDPALTHH